MQPQISSIGNRGFPSAYDKAVSSGNRMINMHRRHNNIVHLDFLPRTKRPISMSFVIAETASFLHRLHEKLSAHPKIHRNPRIHKTNMRNMVKVSMRKKNRSNLRFAIGKIGAGQLVFSVKTRNPGHQPKLKMIPQTVNSSWRKPTRKILRAEIEGLPKIQQNPSALLLYQNLVTANLIHSTVEPQLCHSESPLQPHLSVSS